MTIILRIFRNISILIGCIFALPLLFLLYSKYISANADSFSPRAALVLGAGIRNNQYPSTVLQNRLDTAIKLYTEKKIDTVLVSGDNSSVYYNEPEVMKNYLLQQGIPEQSIVQDFAGYRTIDSCWRAKNVFKATDLYIITQQFHIPRSTFLCKMIGINVAPVPAEDAAKSVTASGYIREIPASWIALWETSTQYTPPVQSDGTEPGLSK
jgi:SanA protein